MHGRPKLNPDLFADPGDSAEMSHLAFREIDRFASRVERAMQRTIVYAFAPANLVQP